MTSGKRSKSARYGAKSNASRAATDAPVMLEALESRVARTCDALRMPHEGSVVVACSGGADSGAAMYLLRKARPRIAIVACYVDHGVRPRRSIERDKRAVAGQARAAGARFIAVSLSQEPKKGESIESALRESRYRALAGAAAASGASLIVTGHNQDDVAESALMALVRGSGVDGIAQMRSRRSIAPGIALVRPLLFASKSILAACARAAGLPVSVDETNADTRYRRNALRRLLAHLERAVPGARQAIARSAAIAAGDRDLLRRIARTARSRCVAPDGRSLLVGRLRRLPRALLRRVIRLEVALRTGSPRDFAFAHCDAIANAIAQRRGGLHHAGARARVMLSGGRLTVLGVSQSATHVDVPKAALAPRLFSLDRNTEVPWGSGRIAFAAHDPTKQCIRGAIAVDAQKLTAGTKLMVRVPRPGDRFVPAGKSTPVSLARFLAKAGLTRDERAHVPLVCAGDTIVAVLGVRAAAGYAARDDAATLELRWHAPNGAGPQRSSR